MSPSEFVQLVTTAYEQNKGTFANKINAEELVPEQANNLQKALYLFYVIQLDYATKSQKLYQGAKKIFKDQPDFFNPKTIIAFSSDELTALLKEYLRPRYINEAVKRYVVNSENLVKKYSADPRLMFTSVSAAKEALKNVKEFRGFGEKIGNFFVRTMINVFNYEYKDIEDILPPVDVHDVRISYLLGYIASPEMSQKNIKEVKQLWSAACKQANKSWLVFDKALWLLGSEGRPKSKEDILALLK